MKKLIFALCTAFVFIFANAQKPKNDVMPVFQVPVDSITKLITYEGVVDVKGIAAYDLYQRINAWFHEYYKNPGEVIRESDSLKTKITGKPRFHLSNPPDKDGTKSEGGITQYTITVAAKDGRYKYELTEFNWKQLSYYSAERWMDPAAAGYLPVYNEYLQQTDSIAKATISSLNNAMTHAKAVKDKDSW